MTAWQLAKQFQDEYCVETFENVLGKYLSCGLVYSTPNIFLAAREVHWDSDRQQISINENDPANCWFVELAAGIGHANPIREFMRVASRPHEYAAWCRRGEMRVRAFNWEKLSKKVGGQ